MILTPTLGAAAISSVVGLAYQVSTGMAVFMTKYSIDSFSPPQTSGVDLQESSD
jgi:hypothetical protein